MYKSVNLCTTFLHAQYRLNEKYILRLVKFLLTVQIVLYFYTVSIRGFSTAQRRKPPTVKKA